MFGGATRVAVNDRLKGQIAALVAQGLHTEERRRMFGELQVSCVVVTLPPW